MADGMLETMQAQADLNHYEHDLAGAVKRVDVEIPDTYRVMSSGTSSEQGYLNAMRDFLSATGIAVESVNWLMVR